jgi:hypothetical protein
VSTSLVVDGALLTLDPAADAPDERDGIIDGLLLALHSALQGTPTDSGAVFTSLVQVLGGIGWSTSAVESTTTQLAKGDVPATRSTTTGLAAAVEQVRHASGEAHTAWTSFPSTTPSGRACLVAQATAGPALVLTYLALDPAEPATGFPWTAVTAPGALVQHTATLTTNPAVWTADLRAQLSTKVAAVVGTEVHTLTTTTGEQS